MVDIILVKYGQPDYEDETIEQVLKMTRDIPYHLTVYDNLPGDENLSVVWNKLIRKSDAEYICLLNTDTIVQEKWLSKLLKTFTEFDRVGAVGPISNRAGGQQGGHKGPGERLPYPAPTLSGFCLVFPKKVWEEVGGFNEAYKLYGEDSEFVFRIMKKKYKVLIRPDTWIFHYGAKSSETAIKKGKDIERIKIESAAMYRNNIDEESKPRVRKTT